MIYLKQKVFAVGGNGGTKAQQSMDIYDTTTKTWTKQDSSLNQNAWMHCVAQLSSNQFIQIGGERLWEGYLKFNEKLYLFSIVSLSYCCIS